MTAEIILGLDALAARPAGALGRRCAVTIGNFDGVHRGHQRLISTARELAHTAGDPAVVVTFDPAPMQLVAPQQAPRPLMHLPQRLQALEQAGADVVLVLQTCPELLNMTPEQFVRDLLVARLSPRHVVEGRNFFFGHNRGGSVRTLEELSGQYGFTMHVVPPAAAELTTGENVTISSSLVRQLVTEGRVADANICLGRPFTLLGTVVHGAGRGRTMDYPTANLDCGEQIRPANGVYACRATIEGQSYPAAVSIGDRPTFDDRIFAIEAFIIDHVGNLYGLPMSLEFLEYLRPQERFAAAEQLRLQMSEDVRRVQERFRQ